MAFEVGALEHFQPPVRRWFEEAFPGPTKAQVDGWAQIRQGQHTLLLAPTGSGKTLAAFLWALDRIMFRPPSDAGCQVLYVSPLKALGVDVERNLRAPIVGVQKMAERMGSELRIPSVGVRSGDTPSAERSRMLRHPPDVLITTPESLYLMATSKAQDILRSAHTVIIDEIHSMVASKRGAHLFLTLERIEHARRRADPPAARSMQRIGLSATQRPLDEVARLLGGAEVTGDRVDPRPVAIVDAGRKKAYDLLIEVPVEDMTRLEDGPASQSEGEDMDNGIGPEELLDDETWLDNLPSGPAAQGPGMGTGRKSIWPSMHPRLVSLIREHRSTMIFVNSRRLAERLSSALNEEAGEPLTRAHHGSIAKDTRAEIEDQLKRGELPCIIATSSLELGVDMGAVDLVVQIEAPPSVASGMQRIGRSGHTAGAASKGVIFPKFRGDLLACASVAERMREAHVEATYYPRNPLDVLAQQLVAAVGVEDWPIDALFDLVRSAAPFSELPRSAFENVLDMLSGRYPSDDFSDLKPRITWDRIGHTLSARKGAKRVAVVNAGTIPDRGLYGVFIAGDGKSRRVGELDEEMVFESRPGDVFLLGATSWRIEEITPDQVLVTPAPGEAGKMPYWHGDRPGRPLEFGLAIGALSRALERAPEAKAMERLTESCGLEPRAARNLIQYLQDQKEATRALPSDRTLVIERFTDEIGDWRVCLLTPFGARVHAPWATAVTRRLRGESGDVEVDVIWSDDGIVFRLPEADEPPEPGLFLPEPEDVEADIVKELGGTSLFAARFRENAGRALLLPKRQPGRRSPLWAQRRKSATLLSVAARFDGFPIILETYRECLKDVFDLPGLLDILKKIRSRDVKVHTVDSRLPSPFASSLLFSYVANFIYDGDAPLAERRAQVLSIDHAQLRELLGEAEMRELLDRESIDELVRQLQRLDRPLRHGDDIHDLLLALGDLRPDELSARPREGSLEAWLEELVARRRVIRVRIAQEERLVAAEHASRYRDALGVALPPGLPAAFLEAGEDPLGELVARFARTRGPFTAAELQERYGLSIQATRDVLARAVEFDRLLEGEFLPGGSGTEYCDHEILKSLKRRALAKLRKQVEPVSPNALGRFLPVWHAIDRPRQGLDAVLATVEQLQGAPLSAAALETEILPARIGNYHPRDLDELCAAGEILWRGLEPVGSHDGRIALFLTDHYPLLAPTPEPARGDMEDSVRSLLRDGGASFFSDLANRSGAFPQDLLDAVWRLVWSGELTNDTLAPLRALLGGPQKRKGPARAQGGRSFRSRRLGPPGSEGRWSLLSAPLTEGEALTRRRTALTQQLLDRHGVLTREAVHAEGVAGGFSTVYPVLKAMEEAGKLRRGYFIEGMGATQFALPGAEDRLRREQRGTQEPDDERPALILAATDPANPYGAAVRWPEKEGARPQRTGGALVILHRGRLIGYVGRTEKSVTTFLPEHSPEREDAARALAEALGRLAHRGGRRALLVGKIDGQPADGSPLAPALEAEGFGASRQGFLKRRGLRDA
ncbi:MAG: DEAD/DEAH box helicase [Myxococcota bacterium]